MEYVVNGELATPQEAAEAAKAGLEFEVNFGELWYFFVDDRLYRVRSIECGSPNWSATPEWLAKQILNGGLKDTVWDWEMAYRRLDPAPSPEEILKGIETGRFQIQTSLHIYTFSENEEDRLWGCVRNDGARPMWAGNWRDIRQDARSGRLVRLCEEWDEA